MELENYPITRLFYSYNNQDYMILEKESTLNGTEQRKKNRPT